MSFDVQNADGVPPPVTGHPRVYPYATIKVGQMFFIAGGRGPSIQSHASLQGRKLNRKFATRVQSMRKTAHGWEACEPDAAGAVKGVGVYRTE
jgi:hypothetical protein